jgi:hypothetical protein
MGIWVEYEVPPKEEYPSPVMSPLGTADPNRTPSIHDGVNVGAGGGGGGGGVP